MAQIVKMRGRVHLRLDSEERVALLYIVDHLEAQLAAAPAELRAYEDEAQQAEYARWVTPEVEDGRGSDITAVRTALEAGETTCALTEAQTLTWLRALNHLRLAAGRIMGVAADGWDEADDEALLGRPEYRMITALGYLQEELVAALET